MSPATHNAIAEAAEDAVHDLRGRKRFRAMREFIREGKPCGGDFDRWVWECAVDELTDRYYDARIPG